MAAPPMAESSLPEKPSLDFGFAFDDANFSDRIIRIEILPDLPGSEPELDDSLSRRRCTRSQKRRRVDSVSNANGDGVAKDNGQSSSTEYSGFRVKNLHVSSPILAANSPFFYKLFSNGMRESHQRHVTLHIQASEEDALMDTLNFMYSNTLPRTTPTALLNILMVADKFEVASCMRYCTQLLCALPMTCESALLYLGLPSTVLMPDRVHQLRDAAKKFLADHFKDFTK